MQCLGESRPHGFILISAGIFHYKGCLSPSNENIHISQFKTRSGNKRERKTGKEKKKEKKKELQRREESILGEELLNSLIIE